MKGVLPVSILAKLLPFRPTNAQRQFGVNAELINNSLVAIFGVPLSFLALEIHKESSSSGIAATINKLY